MSRLRRIFRPSQRRMWQKLCEHIDADFIPGKGFRGRDAIQAYYKNWTIIIDTDKEGKKTFTRIRAPYVNRDSFHFAIYRRKMGSGIRKAFGMEDIIVGHPKFDKAFIIQGNDERKLKMMFDNALIRKLLSYQSTVHLEIHLDDDWVSDPFREGISELSLKMPGIAVDLRQLEELYDLFGELLNHLCHIGSAYEDDPFYGE